ncbi:tRNA (adenosine(37)-N6)-threonylcarbamoyltransferase complex transferase subunit TsaD [Suttonella ornithocola]|uniref:tRNA N6-adenosine threonylcarbamoyltransferase n=1 Tax=Suttonella ornithocola TaxID=279832 RepID=A0A380MNH0_9GAMM|nr:tRNA (adenosine(37)-N6)-threonylcarbamoyltransferase complex transferase subunit TsaD [Suttonella ornithocola]SUO93443.1 t(6)A37 threonylcarbamoyladenosine biosynthesis protein [Suttonella ornithocola]
MHTSLSSDCNILAVESSCDETSIAIYNPNRGALSNRVFSQIDMHRAFGGVVPELAARDHLKRLPILLNEALSEAQLSLSDIHLIAYTAGPGLLGALMTGAAYARSLAYALNCPALPIHHMEGHLLSPFLAEEKPEFPFIALLVSGGHTQLLAVEGVGKYRLLGQTLDDAVGEAFDKTAKIMGLPYPGGPELAALAQEGDPTRFEMPRPMVNRPGMDFSFSGLKTHVRLLIADSPNDRQTYADIAASFQKTIVDTLIIKCRRAWKATGYHDLVISGGVSANKVLRERLQATAKAENKKVFFPPLHICGDNALMIAHAASYHIEKGYHYPLDIPVKARWPLYQ